MIEIPNDTPTEAADEYKPFEVPGTRKKYIVFEGTPEEFNDLFEAERAAKQLAENNQGTATIMCVPEQSVNIALAAVYHGVVLHSLTKVMEIED